MNESDRELAEKIWSKPGKATKTSDEWIADVAELIAAHCEQMARGAKLNGAMDVLLQIRSFRKSYPKSVLRVSKGHRLVSRAGRVRRRDNGMGRNRMRLRP